MESIKNTACNIVSTTANAVGNAVRWAGRKVVELKNVVVGLNIPSKVYSGLSWAAARVQAGWQKALPLLAAAGAILISNTGLGCIALVAAIGLFIAAEKCPPIKNNEAVQLGVRIVSVAAGLLGGFAFGASKPIIA